MNQNKIDTYHLYKQVRQGKISQSDMDRAANYNRNVDVSDIIRDYNDNMKALGENAPLEKQDKVQAKAIKNYMARKVGTGRPYDDYYYYWLTMDRKESEVFNLSLIHI